MHKPSRGVRPSVSVSVTFVYSVETTKSIFILGSHNILVFFLHQTLWQNSPGNSSNVGVECRWDIAKIAILDQYAASFVVRGDGRRSVYEKKPRRYAEDNRTEFICTQW